MVSHNENHALGEWKHIGGGIYENAQPAAKPAERNSALWFGRGPRPAPVIRTEGNMRYVDFDGDDRNDAFQDTTTGKSFLRLERAPRGGTMLREFEIFCHELSTSVYIYSRKSDDTTVEVNADPMFLDRFRTRSEFSIAHEMDCELVGMGLLFEMLTAAMPPADYKSPGFEPRESKTW